MMPEQEEQKSIRLTPEQVARLDPFGARKIPASEELAELLNEGRREEVFPDWTESLINKEKQALRKFFGKEIQVSPLPVEITPERLRHWEKLEMRLHYLPPIEMAQEKNFPGWKVKPKELYGMIREDDISQEALKLPGKWVLVDSRVRREDGLYPDDFLSPIIERLRNSGELSSLGIGTRAYISCQDYHDILIPEIAKILTVKPNQVRLPRAIEFNFLGNAYYPEWGETDTLEWFEDKYGDKLNLIGGRSSYGGLAQVTYSDVISGWQFSAFRPLVEF